MTDTLREKVARAIWEGDEDMSATAEEIAQIAIDAYEADLAERGMVVVEAAFPNMDGYELVAVPKGMIMSDGKPYLKEGMVVVPREATVPMSIAATRMEDTDNNPDYSIPAMVWDVMIAAWEKESA